MKYSIKVNEVTNGSENLRGLATVTFGDSFKFNNIAIMNDPRNDGSLFVSMPSYKTSEKTEDGAVVYKDVFNPTSKEFHDELYQNILDTYNEVHDVQAKNSYTAEFNKNDTRMPDFSVRVTPYEREGSSIKGLATILFTEGMVVNNVSIHEGKDKLFVSMPSYKTKQTDEQGKAVYKDVCYPISAKFREKLHGAILNAYEDKAKSSEKGSLLGKLNENKNSIGNSNETKGKEHNQPEHDTAR